VNEFLLLMNQILMADTEHIIFLIHSV